MTIEEKYSVEGEDLFGRWCLVGVTEAGRQLNPCESLESANTLRDEFIETKKSDPKFAWRNFRIVKTTREIISCDPDNKFESVNP